MVAGFTSHATYVRELFWQPEMGLLHAESFVSWRNLMVLQYGSSYDQLNAYAPARDKAHLTAWVSFNQMTHIWSLGEYDHAATRQWVCTMRAT